MDTAKLLQKIEAAIDLIDDDLHMPGNTSLSVREFYRNEWISAIDEVPSRYRSTFVDSLMDEARELNQLFKEQRLVRERAESPYCVPAAAKFGELSSDRLFAALGGKNCGSVYVESAYSILHARGHLKKSHVYSREQLHIFRESQFNFDFGDCDVHPVMYESPDDSDPWAAYPKSDFGHCATIGGIQGLQSLDIRLVGVGSAGCLVVDQLARLGVGSQSIALHSDREGLDRCGDSIKLQIGDRLTHGFGTRTNPKLGRWAAEEKSDAIRDLVIGADLVFLVAGLGGGTSSGASPVIAKISRDCGIATIAVVTTPLQHEGRIRFDIASQYLRELKDYAHSLMVVSRSPATLLRTRTKRSDILRGVGVTVENAVRGVSEILRRPGMGNLTVSDIKDSLASNSGAAIIGLGSGTGRNRVQHAVDEALNSSSVTEDVCFDAKGLFVSVACDGSLTRDEFDQLRKRVRGITAPGSQMTCGATIDNSLNGELCVAILASGLTMGRAIS
jgi:cell division protein FtsZ